MSVPIWMEMYLKIGNWEMGINGRGSGNGFIGGGYIPIIVGFYLA